MRKCLLLGLVTTLMGLAGLSNFGLQEAWAFRYDARGDRTYDKNVFYCTECHKGGMNGARNPDQDTIPHGNYTSTSDHCSACHSAHQTNSVKLLPRQTLSQTCNYCHDYTGSVFAVYALNGTSSEHTAVSGHRVVGVGYDNFTGTLEIPGGSNVDGGIAILNTTEDGELAQGALTCSSCHTPHGVNTVKRYIGESNRNYSSSTASAEGWIFPSSRILRNTIYGPNTDTPIKVEEYGSAWCAACHQGRDASQAGGYYNHPVDLEKAWGWGSATVVLPMGSNNTDDPRSNNVFVMRDIGATDGYVNYQKPICQQCHASPRDVTKAFTESYPDQRYRNFPHQSYQTKLLVESGDDLCLNCHGEATLP